MAIIDALKKPFKWVPGRAWLAAGGLLVGAFFLQQHDVRIRQQARLQQLQNQASAQISSLRRQAERDVKQANVENAKAIAELEQRRQKLEKQNQQLSARLSGLRWQAHLQTGEVAALPISQIVTRVATQLGLDSADVAGEEKASARQGAKAQSKLRMTNHTLQNPGADSAARKGSSRGALGAPAGGQSPPLQNPAALPLTSSGARKVEMALVELNACRSESAIETQQVSNCQARAEAAESEVKRLQSSVSSLNQALQAKDKILARQRSESKAELRAARGTFLGRLAHTAEHVAIGVALGVAIGVAVK